MGVIRHHAMVITFCDELEVKQIRKFAKEIGCSVTKVKESTANTYYSFAILPDGSKEGWDESNDGDERRAKVIEYLQEKNKTIDWVEVEFGGNSDAATVISHSK